VCIIPFPALCFQPLEQTADLEALRNQIGIIPQEPAMFSGTLRENIDPWGKYSDAEISAVLKECGLESRSLHAAVGVSGENFSLGEKQLVRNGSRSSVEKQSCDFV
jgi:ABC-type multidrug transport system fused ATPase/permease subunit